MGFDAVVVKDLACQLTGDGEDLKGPGDGGERLPANHAAENCQQAKKRPR